PLPRRHRPDRRHRREQPPREGHAAGREATAQALPQGHALMPVFTHSVSAAVYDDTDRDGSRDVGEPGIDAIAVQDFLVSDGTLLPLALRPLPDQPVGRPVMFALVLTLLLPHQLSIAGDVKITEHTLGKLEIKGGSPGAATRWAAPDALSLDRQGNRLVYTGPP